MHWEVLAIPAFAIGLCVCLYLLLLNLTAPVRAKHRETLKQLRKQYGDEYADWWGEKMGMSKRDIRRSK